MSLVRRIAYHEAGHAVAAIHLRLGVDYAHIGDGVGNVQFSARAGIMPHEKITFSLAGFAAEVRHDPAATDSINSIHDFAKAAERLAALEARGHYGHADIQHYFDQEHEIVTACWADVCAVADALEQHKTLNSMHVSLILLRVRALARH